MTTDLEANLSWARQAVHYVKDHISVGNKWIQGDMEDIGALAKKWVPLLGLKAVDLLTYLSEITRLSLATKLGVEWDPHLWILSPVERNQREIEDLAETMHDKSLRKKAYVLARAQIAEDIGIGNCAEHAAMACLFLLNRRVRPLELMIGGDSEHAFVVIGRVKNSKLAEPEHWGPSAVICDAWMARRSSYETSSDERERGYYVSSRLWSNMKLSSRRLAPQVRFEETDI
jgi:hypothetical protein